MKKSIRDTYVYKVLGLETSLQNCSSINKDLASYELSKLHIEQIVNDFKFKVNIPQKNRVIDGIKSGAITIINTEKVNNIPTWLVGDGHGAIKTAVSNIFSKTKVRSNDEPLVYNPREIFAQVQLASNLRDFYLKENKILSSNILSSATIFIYTEMVYKVLDVLYSLNVGQDWLKSYVRIHIALFVTSYLLERTNPNDSLFENYKQQISRLSKSVVTGLDNLENVSASYSYTKPDAIVELTKNISMLSPILKDLDITIFLRKFIMMYGESALMMLENYQYFLAYILSASISGNLVKDFNFESVMGTKKGADVYVLFMNLTQ